MFLQRGIIVSHEAVRAWEMKRAPRAREALRKRRHSMVGTSWYVDETYVRVQGRWCYLLMVLTSAVALRGHPLMAQ
jgi:putative transposase